MSAHAGLFYFDGRAVPRQAIRTLAAANQPYGPDRAGELCPSPGVALIYRGLQVTPEDAFEQQPISLEGDKCLTWDGRLDNRHDLAMELGLPASSTLPDSRIAAEGYRRWGDDVFLRLIGDWSIAVWDAESRTVTLATDFVAIRGLFYVVTDDYCAWSTSLEALVELTGKQTDFDDDYLQAVAIRVWLPIKTPYRDIHVLSGGHTVRLDSSGGSSLRQYWHVPTNEIRYRDRRDYAAHLRWVFRDAVASRLRSSHSVWMELSGGWDSSSVVCMAARIAADGQFSGRSLGTLSHVTPGSPESDETRFIEAVTAHTGLPGIVIPLESDAGPNFPAPIHVRDVNPALVSVYERMRAAKARTLMTGGFGDVVMGNFPMDVTSIVWAIRLVRPIELIRNLRAWGLASQRTAWQLLRMSLDQLLPADVEAKALLRQFVASWSPGDGTSSQRPTGLLNERVIELVLRTHETCVRWSRQEEHPHVSRRFLRYLAYDMLTGRCTSPPEMPQTIKTHPFRDRRLIEYIASIPVSIVCEPGRPRALMRDALGPILPERISRRFSKGYAQPYFARRAGSIASVLANPFVKPAVVERGYVSALVLNDEIDRCRVATAGDSSHLVGVSVLESWLINALAREKHVPESTTERR